MDKGWTPAFKYVPDVVSARGAKAPPAGPGCSCAGGCLHAGRCACAQASGSKQLPYASVSADSKRQPQLVTALPVVIECGPNCACPPSCPNRVTQQGLRFRLEVFRTADGRGWGVRCWDTLPPGQFICDFVGEVRHLTPARA